ncbi:MAG: GAF domain-containing protein [Gammaproteobacteria bacterium]|nr:GAF domain-containing protein [Gammaproteobacteria bacterium]MCK5092156.1 GAF domain-containing protein [Gammaproteobacteria bacterium]
MESQEIATKLEELKSKQERIDRAWEKTGNKELLQFFIEIIPRVLDVERCSIFIHNPKEENVWLECGSYLEEKQITAPIVGSLVGEVISTGQWKAMSGMDEQVGHHDVVGMQTGFEMRNTLCVPVGGVTEDTITGVIQVMNKARDADFTDEDREILEKLAFHIQINIENIFLKQELYKVSEQLSEMIDKLESRLNN